MLSCCKAPDVAPATTCKLRPGGLESCRKRPRIRNPQRHDFLPMVVGSMAVNLSSLSPRYDCHGGRLGSALGSAPNIQGRNEVLISHQAAKNRCRSVQPGSCGLAVEKLRSILVNFLAQRKPFIFVILDLDPSPFTPEDHPQRLFLVLILSS